jgi:hypothetical protein
LHESAGPGPLAQSESDQIQVNQTRFDGTCSRERRKEFEAVLRRREPRLPRESPFRNHLTRSGRLPFIFSDSLLAAGLCILLVHKRGPMPKRFQMSSAKSRKTTVNAPQLSTIGELTLPGRRAPELKVFGFLSGAAGFPSGALPV